MDYFHGLLPFGLKKPLFGLNFHGLLPFGVNCRLQLAVLGGKKREKTVKPTSLRKQPSFFAPGPTPPGAKKDGCFRRLEANLL